MADEPGTSKLPRRDGLVDQVQGLVDGGFRPAVFAVEVSGFEGLVDVDADGAHGAVREVEARLDRLVRGRDVLGFEPPARFLLACASVLPESAGGLVERIRGGAALPVDVGGEAFSLVLDVGVAFWSDGVAAVELVDRAEEDLDRARPEV